MTEFDEPVRVNVSDSSIAFEAKANGTAVSGVSAQWHGVVGVSTHESAQGVYAEANGTAMLGKSKNWLGVYGESTGGTGVEGVRGQGKGSTCGVAGHSEQGIGVYGKGGLLAAKFDGKVKLTGALEGTLIHATTGLFAEDIVALNGAFTGAVSGDTGRFAREVYAKKFVPSGGDYAETFASEGVFEPGTVLVIGEDGLMAPCDAQYDTRATGVVSGAGGLTPGTVMESNPDSAHHVTLALAGQVYVKADPQYGPIAAGDLLTTSPSEGCAMRVSDRGRAVGAILGKALATLDGEPGLVRMLVTPS
ncbi:hypothetical protein OG564_17700 [Streptomyces sp. NBC_01280]|uniref:hypothetical protein n=1 Tax=Streptomyces sp. NBC_01280 TaxID=2903810 RepID=UPI002E3617B0|nr:hypothetical protein [Streptomyces sp. NBC_01280]